MKLIYDPDAAFEFQLTCAPHTPARKAAIDAIRNWKSVDELVAFAAARHGYENTDGFFGVTYPSDLDESDRANGTSIPIGYIEANAWYGAHDGDTHQLPEIEYLELLRQYLVLNKHSELAKQVDRLLTQDA